ncbi:MAG: VPLPA-CTERM sorting domain-containing protein [Gammaproteobacteria bacterium]
MSHKALFTVAMLGALAHPAAQAITYQTFDVTAAIGHGGNLGDGYIRGSGSDSDLVNNFGVPPAYANPNGSLSYAYSYNLPFGQFDVAGFFSGTSTWDNFVVTGNSVDVRSFALSGTSVNTNQALFNLTNVANVPHSLSATLDGRMYVQWTADFEYTGPFNQWLGTHTEHDYQAAGGFVVNDAGSGLQQATAAQFDFLGAGHDQAAADYLNDMVANHLPANWTHAGLWLFADDYTSDNTRGFFAGSLIGGSQKGYNIWYSTDEFLFGVPIPDANGDGLFSITEVEDLVANGQFPDVVGLNLAGNGFAQLYDVALIAGDGGVQTVIFEYDENLLAPGEEALLSIVHFTNGIWETPFQILDTDANTITVTVDNFSPFALVTTPVPLPAAAWLLGSALAGLAVRGRRPRRC